jgi:hypothetical protein
MYAVDLISIEREKKKNCFFQLLFFITNHARKTILFSIIFIVKKQISPHENKDKDSTDNLCE